MKEFLKIKGININARDADGNSALHHAVNFGSVEVVKLLLDAGADVNASGVLDTTAAILATESSRLDMLKVILYLGSQ